MKTVVILGMHRSMTSLVAKGMSSEMWIGKKLLRANESNPTGHYENLRFMQLNQDVLEAAGGSWDSPPPEEAILSVGKQFAGRIQSLIAAETKAARRRHLSIWGWKEPRTTLTIRIYMPYLERPHFVCCFREPTEVAKSLKQRNGFPIEQGLVLAQTYNERLIRFASEFALGRP